MEAIDWSKLFKKYKGKWLALEDDEITVIASGDTAKEVWEKAQEKGFKQPILTRMPKQLVPIPFFPLPKNNK